MIRDTWTADDDQRLREMAAAGTSYRTMAKAFTDDGTPRSKTSIERRLRRLGIQVDRTATIAATEAHRIDAKARRAMLAEALLGDAERLREQLWSNALAYSFGGKDNTYAEHTLPQPPHADQLKIVQATGAAIGAALKLDLHDSDGGHAEVVGMVDSIAAAIKAAADEIETDENTP